MARDIVQVIDRMLEVLSEDGASLLPPDKVPTWAKRAGAILSGQAT